MRRSAHAAALAIVSALALPTAAGAEARIETWTTTSQHVDPKKVQFNGSDHPRELRVNVLLPDGYDGGGRFPVLYLLHGHGDAYNTWARPDRGDVQRIAKGLGAIVVMPEGDRGWYTDWWNGGRRGDPAWERYYLEELIPLVERRLRIRPGRRWRAIAGLSMGGEGTMFFASQRPGYFGSAAAFSGTLSIQRPTYRAAFDAANGERQVDVFGDYDRQRFYWQGHDPTSLVGNLEHTRLFAAVGDGTPGASPGEVTNYFGQVAEAELRQHSDEFVAAARSAGAPVTYRPQQGIHDWPYWRGHLAQAIEWGPFAPVEEAPTEWSYRTVARSGEAWGLRFQLSRPPEALVTLRRRGYELRADGDGTMTLTTPEGCRLSDRLPFEREIPTGCRIRLSVSPRSPRARRLTRFRFRATVIRRGRRLPLRGARVWFAGRRARTNARGLARIRVRLPRRGPRRAVATQRGRISGGVTVRAR